MVHCHARKMLQMRSILAKVLPGIFLIIELNFLAEGNFRVAFANGIKSATVWKTRLRFKVILTNWKVI